ncbi:MAG: GtrA family protein [Bacteroidetes bacterium]|nr:GtrA family protein [Bacteroidota bacterium]
MKDDSILSINYFKKKEIRFVIFGCLNTLFGYFSSLFFYYLLENFLGFFLTILIINVINLSFSFVILKTYVFKSRGSWLHEYFRSYLAYANIFILNISLLYLFVEVFNIKFYISSMFTIILCAGVSYVINLKFTFR